MSVLAARLREAREYVGFTQEQVAEACEWEIDRVVTLEDGTGGDPTAIELKKLGRLYRRPIPWFSDESRFEPGPDLLRQVEGLTDHDREAVLDFFEWVQGAGAPSLPGRPLAWFSGESRFEPGPPRRSL